MKFRWKKKIVRKSFCMVKVTQRWSAWQLCKLQNGNIISYDMVWSYYFLYTTSNYLIWDAANFTAGRRRFLLKWKKDHNHRCVCETVKQQVHMGSRATDPLAPQSREWHWHKIHLQQRRLLPTCSAKHKQPQPLLPCCQKTTQLFFSFFLLSLPPTTSHWAPPARWEQRGVKTLSLLSSLPPPVSPRKQARGSGQSGPMSNKRALVRHPAQCPSQRPA